VNGNHSRPRPRRRQLVGLILVLPLVAAAAACGEDGGSGGGDQPLVVATHSILGDVVTNVAGDQAEVEVIMPPGADPHEFEPSAAQVALLTEADLIVSNGLGFEQGLVDAVESAEADGAELLSLGEQLDPIPFEDPHADEEDADEGHEHAEGGDDPHWFTDPRRVATASVLIGEALADVDGVDAAAVTESAQAYAAEVEAADAAVEEQLAAVAAEDRTLVTNHEVFGYFADRYGFDVVGVIVPGGSTLAEPSSAELAALVEVIDETGVSAIFADSSSSSDLADVLADETGGEVAVVDLFTESLGDEASGGATYLELIATNADRITTALGS